jgi:hypothetical protein
MHITPEEVRAPAESGELDEAEQRLRAAWAKLDKVRCGLQDPSVVPQEGGIGDAADRFRTLGDGCGTFADVMVGFKNALSACATAFQNLDMSLGGTTDQNR